MDRFQVPSALAPARRILVAGAGGGFDVYAGLPLFHTLRASGKSVFLANLSFTNLPATDAPVVAPRTYAVGPEAKADLSYFPERVLARSLRDRGEPSTVYAFEKTGVEPFLEAYRALVAHLDVDAVVLVDGGVDILMRGDEAGLGTPEEDMASLATVARLEVPMRLVVCVGFGVDAYHGVCHAHFLENVAALSAEGAFLGAQALLPSMPESAFYLAAVAEAEAAMPVRSSIVNASIGSAIEGHFGDYHRSARTGKSELFINPLMTFVWAFDLAAVARRSRYLHMLSGTRTMFEITSIIEAFRKGVERRPRVLIPH